MWVWVRSMRCATCNHHSPALPATTQTPASPFAPHAIAIPLTHSHPPLTPQAPEDATPLIVASKSVGEVDVEWFLLTVPIKDHTGTLRTEFPIENRMIPQVSG